jgi:hypothetical protein
MSGSLTHKKKSIVHAIQHMNHSIVAAIRSAKEDIIEEIQNIHHPDYQHSNAASMSSKERTDTIINEVLGSIAEPQTHRNSTSLGPMMLEEILGNTPIEDSGPMTMQELSSPSPETKRRSKPVLYILGGNHKPSHKQTNRVHFRKSQRKRPKHTVRRKRS